MVVMGEVSVMIKVRVIVVAVNAPLVVVMVMQ